MDLSEWEPETFENHICGKVVQHHALFSRYIEFSPFFVLYYIWIIGERTFPRISISKLMHGKRQCEDRMQEIPQMCLVSEHQNQESNRYMVYLVYLPSSEW